MGTRSLTVVHDGPKDKVILCLYRQFDGYPSGMGMDLKHFLENAKLVNGYSREDEKDTRTFNGMTDLAVRLVTHLKNEHAKSIRERGDNNSHPASGEDAIGQYHILSYNPKDLSSAEYIYHISSEKNTVKLICHDVYEKKNVEIKENSDD